MSEKISLDSSDISSILTRQMQLGFSVKFLTMI